MTIWPHCTNATGLISKIKMENDGQNADTKSHTKCIVENATKKCLVGGLSGPPPRIGLTVLGIYLVDVCRYGTGTFNPPPSIIVKLMVKIK